LLTLGIPPNAVMALMVGAMTIHNIQPGPQVMTSNPELFWGLIASMWIGNLMLIILNLPLIGMWIKLLTVPYRWLFPAIVLFCAIGVYSTNNNTWDVWMVGWFGIIGYLFIKLGMEPAPLLLGFILGPMMEENLRRALLLSRGDWSVLVTRPLSATLLGLALLLLIIVLLPAVKTSAKRPSSKSDMAAKATADGQTLLFTTTSTHSIGPAIGAKLPYDTVRDFTPIAHVGNAPSIMLVPNSSPAKTVKEWIEYAKKNPGKLNYASSGNGTIVQLTAELFKAQAGVFVTHIPYKGTGLAIPDLVAGQLDVLFDSLPTGMPHVRDGRLRALAVTTLKRTPLAPDLPAWPTRCPVSSPTPGLACMAPRACLPRWSTG
jgi:hypothetical protein